MVIVKDREILSAQLAAKAKQLNVEPYDVVQATADFERKTGTLARGEWVVIAGPKPESQVTETVNASSVQPDVGKQPDDIPSELPTSSEWLPQGFQEIKVQKSPLSAEQQEKEAIALARARAGLIMIHMTKPKTEPIAAFTPFIKPLREETHIDRNAASKAALHSLAKKGARVENAITERWDGLKYNVQETITSWQNGLDSLREQVRQSIWGEEAPALAEEGESD